ncbi:MAG: amidase [Pseudomonadota bacterium]
MRGFLCLSTALLALAGCAEEATSQGEPPRPDPAPRTTMVKAPEAESLPRRLQEGTTTPREVVSKYLRRIELIDQSGPKLQSVLLVNSEAVSEAQRLEREVGEGAEKGPLYGLPILIKDNIETKDMPTTAGSRALAANNTGRDAPAVARLRESGAVILGKTKLSEWANFRSSGSISGWSAVGGLTRNPHDLSRNACGSSSGSGAAVAAGLSWAALGTETNGSVTCPAALNGIVGFKPTVGMISRRHVVPISSSQDTIGPMTTSVRDAAMLMNALAGTNEGDAATADADGQKTDFVASLDGASLEGKRLGVLRWAESRDARERAVFNEALRRAEEAGAILVEIEELGGEPLPGGEGFLVLKAEFKDLINAYLADTAPEVTVRTLPDLIAFNEADDKELSLFGQTILIDSEATEGMAGEDYKLALEALRRRVRDDGIDRLLTENDVEALIAPSFGPAFMIDIIRGDIIANRAGAGWMAAQAGYPHVTVPMGDLRGLPLGLSIMGGQWTDANVLRLGQAFEDILPPRLEPTFRATSDSNPALRDTIVSD